MNVPSADIKLKKKITEIGQFIGNTPLWELKNVFPRKEVKIFAKLEWMQLGESVKARPAYNIIRESIFSGEMSNEKILLDATSGNTGIAYASIGAALRIPVTLCIPENVSSERKNLLKMLGATIIFTSPFESTDGAQFEAKLLAEKFPDKYFYADQYSNSNNWKAHFNHTSEEIYFQTNKEITHFVAGLGTTGTFTGTGRKLKLLNEKIQLVSLQPETIMHGLEGWKHLETAMVPAIYDPTLADGTLSVPTNEAYNLIKIVAQKEGLLISPSSAANLAGAIKVSENIPQGAVVTIFPDNLSKYGEVLNSIN